MSLFRSPEDPSSSDGSTSEKEEFDDYEDPEDVFEEATGAKESHSRQPSFDEAISGSVEGVLENRDPELEVAGLDAEGHAAMMTTALLEYYCVSKAAEILNEQQGNEKKYTRDSPEARLLGRRLYVHKSRFLSENGVLAAGVDGDDWEATRKYYRDSLDILGLSALEGLDLNARSPQLPPAEGGPNHVVLTRRAAEVLETSPANRPAPRRLLTSGTEVGFLEHVATPLDYFHHATPQPMNHFPFIDLPGVYQPYKQSILMSRYATEFEEESLIGKGSYGIVYKAKHYVDGQSYAIKKIPLSTKRLKQLQKRGLEDLDHILREIRTLARLDHSNVVRYFGAWAEYNVAAQGPLAPTTPAAKPFGLLNYGSDGEDDSNHGIVFEDESDHGVVFEVSSKDEGASAETQSISRSLESQQHSNDIAVARKARRSFVESESEGGEDDFEAEMEPFGQQLSVSESGQAGTTTSELPSDIFSDGAGGNASIQITNKTTSTKLPPITLHIQMSLHPLSLSKYIRPQSEGSAEASPSHCFHLAPSIKLLLGILSGVEYLHAQGIIHRDLKPANVFLSFLQQQNGIICQTCKSEGNMTHKHHTVPRIGDFGLVADASPGVNEEATQLISPAPGPVGTEFYRPPIHHCSHGGRGRKHDPSEDSDKQRCGCSDLGFQINESLDVYALGVILFELVYKCSTRMERQLVLSDLTCSPNGLSWAKRTKSAERKPEPTLPTDFKTKVGKFGITGRITDGRDRNAVTVTEKLAQCILSMVELDSRQRSTCEDVRKCLTEILCLLETGPVPQTVAG